MFFNTIKFDETDKCEISMKRLQEMTSVIDRQNAFLQEFARRIDKDDEGNYYINKNNLFQVVQIFVSNFVDQEGIKNLILGDKPEKVIDAPETINPDSRTETKNTNKKESTKKSDN